MSNGSLGNDFLSTLNEFPPGGAAGMMQNMPDMDLMLDVPSTLQ